jgi:hypothetical protein
VIEDLLALPDVQFVLKYWKVYAVVFGCIFAFVFRKMGRKSNA